MVVSVHEALVLHDVTIIAVHAVELRNTLATHVALLENSKY